MCQVEFLRSCAKSDGLARARGALTPCDDATKALAHRRAFGYEHGVLGVSRAIHGRDTSHALGLCAHVPDRARPRSRDVEGLARASLPATVVVKPRGEVAGMAIGAREWNGTEMRALIETLLPAPR